MTARAISGALLAMGCASTAPSVTNLPSRAAASAPAVTPTPAAPAAPPGAPAAATESISLHVCFDNAQLFGERTVGLSRVVEALHATMRSQGTTPVRIGVGACGNEPLLGCFGRPGIVACRADDVAQLITSASLSASLAATAQGRRRFARSGAAVPSDAIAGVARDIVSVRGASSAGDSASDRGLVSDRESGVEARINWVARDLQLPPEHVSGVVASAATSWRTPSASADSPLARDAIALMLEFIVGHELSHARGQRCDEAQASRSEDDGFFAFASRAAAEGAVCPYSPNADELRADRCALRVVRHGAAARQLAGRSPPEAQNAIAIAADALAWALMTHHAENLASDPQQHLMRKAPGYLHPALRVTLLTNELRKLQPSGYHGTCDRVARNILISMQNEYHGCPDVVQEFHDMLLLRLPDAVTAAFSGREQWRDPESFWCSETSAEQRPSP